MSALSSGGLSFAASFVPSMIMKIFYLSEVSAICVDGFQQAAPDGAVIGGEELGEHWHHLGSECLSVQSLANLQQRSQCQRRCAPKLQCTGQHGQQLRLQAGLISACSWPVLSEIGVWTTCSSRQQAMINSRAVGLTFFCTIGSGRDGSVAGRRLKKRSFSLESLTAMDSRKAIVSTSLVFSAALSDNLAGLSLLTDCEASSL